MDKEILDKKEFFKEEKQNNLRKATIDYLKEIEKYESCKYGRLQYDPNLYKQAILNIIDLARRNGLRVNCFDEILEIENTTSEDEQTIDFN